MSSRGAGPGAQSRVVYAAGLVQGIVLVTFPAASTIFTSASSYGLSSSQYGGMFLPQAITAVGFSLLQGNLSRRLGGKPVYLAGLCANLAAMILLIASRFVMSSQAVAYPLLLVATGWVPRSPRCSWRSSLAWVSGWACRCWPRSVWGRCGGLGSRCPTCTARAPWWRWPWGCCRSPSRTAARHPGPCIPGRSP
jgi:MFS family permease